MQAPIKMKKKKKKQMFSHHKLAVSAIVHVLINPSTKKKKFFSLNASVTNVQHRFNPNYE